MTRTLSIATLLCTTLIAACVAGDQDTDTLETHSSETVQTSETINVWHWNVAGDTFHNGRIGSGLIDVAANSIRAHNISFASLNEICRVQYDNLAANLDGGDTPQWIANGVTSFRRFAAVKPPQVGQCGCTATPCNTNTELGVAIFSKYQLDVAETTNLSTSNDSYGAQRKLLCVNRAFPSTIRYCTAHVTPDDPDPNNPTATDTNEQMNIIQGKIGDYRAAGDSVIIAGDFNAEPDYSTFNDWYAVNTANNGNNNTGHFRELDDSDSAHCSGYGEKTVEGPGISSPCATGEAKIDAVWVHEDDLANFNYDLDSRSISNECDTTADGDNDRDNPCSDHRLIEGYATLEVIY